MAGRPRKLKTKTVFVRVPEELAKRLKEDALKEDRELSWLIRRILLAYYAGDH